MTETKVPLDTVVKHLSDTLSENDSALRKLEQSIDSVGTQMTRVSTPFVQILNNNLNRWKQTLLT